jgi:hypothetical protein
VPKFALVGEPQVRLLRAHVETLLFAPEGHHRNDKGAPSCPLCVLR